MFTDVYCITWTVLSIAFIIIHLWMSCPGTCARISASVQVSSDLWTDHREGGGSDFGLLLVTCCGETAAESPSFLAGHFQLSVQ